MTQKTLSSWLGLWVLTAFCLAIVRSGVRRLGVHESFVQALDDFPNISAYWRTSLLPLVLAKYLGVESSTGWVLLHLAATVAVIAGAAFLFLRCLEVDDALLAFGLFLLSPIGTVLFGDIGFYDVWVIGGAIVLVLGRSSPVRILGALILLGGNFELGCVALLAYSVWTLSLDDRSRFRQTVIESALASGVIYGLLMIVYRNAPDPDSRGEWLLDQAKGSIVSAVNVLPLLLFSFFGLLWLLVARYVSGRSSNGSRVWAFLGLVAIPALFTILTLDGTRVFVSIAAPATIAMIALRETLKQLGPIQLTRKNLLIAAALIPALQVHMGEIINPYAELYGRLNLF
jgi:hypothetical protein